jgi:hypothetical protein
MPDLQGSPVRGLGPLAAAVSVFILAAIAMGSCARPRNSRAPIAGDSGSVSSAAAIPPIDAEAPIRTETATFALG